MLCLGRESDMWGRGAVGYRITVAPAGAWGVPGPGGDTVMGPGQGEQNMGDLLKSIRQEHAHLSWTPQQLADTLSLLAFPPMSASIMFADVLWELDFRLLGRKG